MTDSLRDKLQALASDLSAEGLPSIARRIDAILDAEGQPEDPVLVELRAIRSLLEALVPSLRSARIAREAVSE